MAVYIARIGLCKEFDTGNHCNSLYELDSGNTFDSIGMHLKGCLEHLSKNGLHRRVFLRITYLFTTNKQSLNSFQQRLEENVLVHTRTHLSSSLSSSYFVLNIIVMTLMMTLMIMV